MAFNERLQQIMEEDKAIKPFNYDNVFRENNELKKQHSLLQVKLKALTMEEKDVDLWWDAVQDIAQKDIRKVCRMYERNEKFYRHKIS
jgi:ABC-type phosphate transport system auxiliary subunit